MPFSDFAAGPASVSPIYTASDTAHAGSGPTTSNTITVNLRTTTTAVSCTSPVFINQASTCTATVTDTAAGTVSTPAGTVLFAIVTGTGTLGTPNPCTLVSGSCSVTFTPSTGGTATVSGTYTASDTTHAGSGPSTSNTITVNLRTTSTAVSCTTPVFINQASTCTATVTDSAAGTASTPAGTVLFAIVTGTGSLGTPNPCTLVSGSCSVTFTGSAAGTATVSGTYTASDTTHAGSGPIRCNTITVNLRTTSTPL